MEINFFYQVPNYSRYFITEKGALYNSKTKTLLSGSKNPDGYVNYRMCDDNGVYITMGRHRLMCIVFKPTELDIRDLVANHLNGIKGDDRLDNLEWTTYTGNIEHAGANGFTLKCSPIQVLDVDTGVVTDYPSASSAARDFKLSKDSILYRLRFDDQKVFPERKQYRFNRGNEPWAVNPDPELSISQYTNRKSVVVHDVDTGEDVCYPSLTVLSNLTKLSMGFLSMKLKNEEQPFLPPNKLFCWEENKSTWRKFDRFLEIEKNGGVRVVVLIADSGEKEIIVGVCKAASFLNVGKSTLLYRLNSKFKPSYNGYKCYYYKDLIGSPYLETDKVL